VVIVPRAIIVLAAVKQRKRYLNARKRQAPLKPLIPVGRKLLLDYKEAITILKEVLFK